METKKIIGRIGKMALPLMVMGLGACEPDYSNMRLSSVESIICMKHSNLSRRIESCYMIIDPDGDGDVDAMYGSGVVSAFITQEYLDSGRNLGYDSSVRGIIERGDYKVMSDEVQRLANTKLKTDEKLVELLEPQIYN